MTCFNLVLLNVLFYFYCVQVVYLDFLNLGHQQLPSTLPRLVVWKGDMIEEKAKLDSVQGHIYGKHPVRLA